MAAVAQKRRLMALPAGLFCPNKNFITGFYPVWDIGDENVASLRPFEK
jgi:hypothetical protein